MFDRCDSDGNTHRRTDEEGNDGRRLRDPEAFRFISSALVLCRRPQGAVLVLDGAFPSHAS